MENKDIIEIIIAAIIAIVGGYVIWVMYTALK
jgi:hypothetical protein